MTFDPIDTNDDGTVDADVDNELIDTGEENNRLQVPQYGTLQEAHDALPSDGGKIQITEDLDDTADVESTITKPVIIEGHSGVFFTKDSSNEGGEGQTVLNTAGIDGITVRNENVVIRDLALLGDGSSGDGLRLGDAAGDTLKGLTLENVSVRNNGGHNLYFAGRHVFPTFRDVSSIGAGQDGWHFDVTDFVTVPMFEQCMSQDNGRHGIYVTNTNVFAGARGFITTQRNGQSDSSGYNFLSDNPEFSHNHLHGWTELGANDIEIDGKGFNRLILARNDSALSSINYVGTGAMYVEIQASTTSKTFGNASVMEYGFENQNINMAGGTVAGTAGGFSFGGGYIGCDSLILNQDVRWNNDLDLTTNSGTGAEIRKHDGTGSNPPRLYEWDANNSQWVGIGAASGTTITP